MEVAPPPRPPVSIPLNVRDWFSPEPHFYKFRLVSPWKRRLHDGTTYERYDTPARIVRTYFDKLARAHHHRRWQHGTGYDGDGGRVTVPEWFLSDFDDTPLHARILASSQPYVWHPLDESFRHDASKSASHLIYNTCVNRMQYGHVLMTNEWIPLEVRKAVSTLIDQHHLLTLYMEGSGDFSDERLHATLHYGAGRGGTTLPGCRGAPTTSIYALLRPRLECAFVEGSLPDFISVVCNYVPLWGEKRVAVHADPVINSLVAYAYRVLPIPFRKRDFSKLVSADVLSYSAMYNIITRLVFATLLGAYSHSSYVPNFATRRKLYARFALKPMSPRELAAWVNQNKNTVRYVIMEYVFFAIGCVPPLNRVFEERYKWSVIVQNMRDACEFIRRSYESSCTVDQRNWLLRATRVRINRQAKFDPLACTLRNAVVQQLYRRYSTSSVWGMSSAALRTFRPTREDDRTLMRLVELINQEDVFRRLAAFLREPHESASTPGSDYSDAALDAQLVGVGSDLIFSESYACARSGNASGNATSSTIDGDSSLCDTARRLCVAIDQDNPLVTVCRWIELLGNEDTGATGLGWAIEPELREAIVRGIASTFYDPSFGVEEQLEEYHKNLLKSSYRPVEEHFVERALDLCERLNDQFYVDANYRDAPPTYTPKMDAHMREEIFKYPPDANIDFYWLVIFKCELRSIMNLRSARRLFCSETLRAQIGTTLEALLLTRYHDYYVFYRFLFWRNQHMSVRTYDLPAEMTRQQLERCLELRHCSYVADLEPTLSSYYFCRNCRKFKTPHTGHPSDLFPVLCARRKRVKRMALAATHDAAALMGVTRRDGVTTTQDIFVSTSRLAHDLFTTSRVGESSKRKSDGNATTFVDYDPNAPDPTDTAGLFTLEDMEHLAECHAYVQSVTVLLESTSKRPKKIDKMSKKVKAARAAEREERKRRREQDAANGIEQMDDDDDDFDSAEEEIDDDYGGGDDDEEVHVESHASTSSAEAAKKKADAAAASAAAAKAKARPRKSLMKVDVSNRVIDPRNATSLGCSETIYNPLDDSVRCKNMSFDTDQRIAALRHEADVWLENYAAAHAISKPEAIRWLTRLKPQTRLAYENRVQVAAARARKRQAATPTPDTSPPHTPTSDGSASSSDGMEGIAPSTLTIPMLGEDKGYGQRRSIAGTRKRRSSTHASMFAPTPLPSARASLNPASLSSTDVDPSVRPPPDTQHYKRISKRERHLRETAQCGFENLELVNLIGRAFLFFGKIYFRCPRCVVPSIATYHCSKFGGDPDFVLTCTFCKTTISDAAKGTTKPLEPLAPTRRFHCVICEHSKVYLATALETVLVYDDDDPLAPRLRMHQFCRQHNRLVFSSAGRVLHMSTIRKALAENWTSRWDTKSGGRVFAQGRAR